MSNYFISKKNGQIYSHCGNGLKQLKKIYNTNNSQYIYDCEFPNSGRCKICGKQTKFINFKQGYDDFCLECKSSRKHLFIKGYAEFVKENFYLYRNIWKSTECIDPYDGKYYKAKKVPFSAYILKVKSEYDVKSDFWFIEKECLYCGEKFKVHIWDSFERHTCLKHHTFNNYLYFTIIENGIKQDTNIIDFLDKIKNLSYRDFYYFLIENREFIATHKNSCFSIRKEILKVCDQIKQKILLDNETKYTYPSKIFWFDNKIPVKIFKKNKKWNFTKNRWDFLFIKNEPLICKWCDNIISEITRLELFELENEEIVCLPEYKCCSMKCRNEFMKFSNTYRDKFHDEIFKMKEKQSFTIKTKIKNGEFTPSIKNSLTKKSIFCLEYPNNYFRSSWELIFWYCNKEIIPYENYEKIRIPYIGDDNKFHNYIVDFVDTKNKILYEIKPSGKIEDLIVVKKSEAAKNWCFTNGYSYCIISDNYFKQLVQEGVDFSFLGEKKESILKSFQRG